MQCYSVCGHKAASTAQAFPLRHAVSNARINSIRPARRSRSGVVTYAVDKAAVLTDVRSIIAEQLGTDLDKVSPESKFAELGADSLDTVEIMMALEEKFEIQLDEEGSEKISTVQEAADLIANQISNA